MKKLNPMALAGVALVLVLVIALAVQSWRLSRAQDAGVANALRADSIAAALDTTRRVALSAKDSARILGDSLHALERRGVQVAEVKRDDFDKATGRTTIAKGGITVTPGTIATTSTSGPTSTTAEDVREATFHVDSSAAVSSARYVADVAVRVPPSPAPASLRLTVTPSPIALSPRIQCGAPDAGGIRPASLAVLAPAGVTLELEPLTLDVHACNPDFGKPRGIRVSLTTTTIVALVASTVTAIVVSR